MKQAPIDITKFKMGEFEVVIDPEVMRFNDSSLSEFMQNVYTWVDYFGRMHARADFIYSMRKSEYEIAYSKKFSELKGGKGTVAECEARAKIDDEVIDCQKRMIKAKFRVDVLTKHLKAWDAANSNAQNRGHFLRKEMDKLGNDIYEIREKELYDRVQSGIEDAESYVERMR